MRKSDSPLEYRRRTNLTHVQISVVVSPAAGGPCAGLRPASSSRADAREAGAAEAGLSARRIAADLAHAGIIRSQYAPLAWHYLHGRKPQMGASTPLTIAPLRAKFMTASPAVIFTSRPWLCRKGYNTRHRRSDRRGAAAQDFLKLARSDTSSIIRTLIPRLRALRVILFPDTYHFTRGRSLCMTWSARWCGVSARQPRMSA